MRAVCPHCGSSHAHRTPRRASADRVLGLAGVRLYRCADCGRKHHGLKWLKLVVPDLVGGGPVAGRRGGHWKQRYHSWRLREGRHAHKAMFFALAVLAAVCGFFSLLLYSASLFCG